MEITIKTITNKTSKTGTPFWVIDAVEGKYTVWDKGISDELYKHLGEKVNVDVKQSGDFWNIRGVVAHEGKTQYPIEAETPSEPIRKSVKGSAYEKDPVGLAVEMFKDMTGQTSEIRMKLCIDAVKQAQEAFK